LGDWTGVAAAVAADLTPVWGDGLCAARLSPPNAQPGRANLGLPPRRSPPLGPWLVLDGSAAGGGGRRGTDLQPRAPGRSRRTRPAGPSEGLNSAMRNTAEPRRRSAAGHSRVAPRRQDLAGLSSTCASIPLRAAEPNCRRGGMAITNVFTRQLPWSATSRKRWSRRPTACGVEPTAKERQLCSEAVDMAHKRPGSIWTAPNSSSNNCGVAAFGLTEAAAH
jgi:hypothetical protein